MTLRTVRILVLLLTTIGLCDFCTRAQSPLPPKPKEQESAPAPAIRVKSRVIEVSVLAQDKHDNPVMDLKKSDFKLYDNGILEPVQFLTVVNSTLQSKLPPSLPPNTFTNNPSQKGYVPGNLVIILQDALNTPFGEQVYANRQLLKYLRQLKPQDHVAIYTLGNKLQILQDFTTSDELLIRAAEAYVGRNTAQQAASIPGGGILPPGTNPGGGGDPASSVIAQMLQKLQNMDNGIAQHYTVDRVEMTLDALLAIASHVRGIPGRKNLLWLSGSFPLAIGLENLDKATTDPTAAPPQFQFDLFERTVRALGDSNVAVYPIDSHGLLAPSTAPPMFQDAVLDPQGYPLTADPHTTMDSLAERTGGLALYNTNAIDHALELATADARFSYTLGYVPNIRWDGKFHKIKISVGRKGVKIRARQGYFATLPPEYSADQRKYFVRQAEASPLDATEIQIVVQLALVPDAGDKIFRVLSTDVFAYGSGIQFMPEGLDEVATVDYIIAQEDERGDVLKDSDMTYRFKLGTAIYQRAMQGGLSYKTTFALDPRATRLRIITRDAASGALGSVTIPLQGIASKDNSASPLPSSN